MRYFDTIEIEGLKQNYKFCSIGCKNIFKKSKLPLIDSNHINKDEFDLIQNHKYFNNFLNENEITVQKLDLNRKESIDNFNAWLRDAEEKINRDLTLKEKAKEGKLTILESATLALKLIEGQHFDDIRSVTEILSDTKEIDSIIDDKNNQFKDSYIGMIEELYLNKGIKSSDPHYDIFHKKDIENCMKLGKKKLLLELVDVLPESMTNDHKVTNDHNSKRLIVKSRAWKDIKNNRKK